MPKQVLGKTDQQKRDQDLVTKIKPKLRKFVIDQQVSKAAENIKAQQDQEKKLTQMEAEFREVIKRAQKLARIALLNTRIWRQYPPALSTEWMTSGAFTVAQQREQQMDIWAFARYLVKEYFANYLEHQNDKAGYPNPMDETQLTWFWLKFNADLRLLIKADAKRVEAGNEPVVLAKEEKPKEEPKLITDVKKP